MRVGAPEFGPIPLIGVRVAVAAAFLLLVLLARGQLQALVAHPRRRELFWLGLLNSALPFCLFAFAALGITAGLNSILNSTAPMWTALVAFVWLRERPSAGGLLGLLLGLSAPYWIGLALSAALLAYEHAIVRPDDLSRLNIAFFNVNGVISVVLFLGTLLATLVPV